MSGQICLCRKRTGGTFTENGLYSECSFCHLFCTKEDAFVYDQAVKKFLATKQPQPLCCMDIIRTKAKMKAKTDPEDDNFGRPYFVCSKKTNPCRYFEWGDQAIIPRPLCEHGKPCHMQKEWKGPNKGRYFFSCAEPGRCKFFKWMEAEDEREIAEDTSTEFLRLNDEFPHYTDAFLESITEHHGWNEEIDVHSEYMELIRAKELLEKVNC